jgi:hypothetical protein
VGGGDAVEGVQNRLYIFLTYMKSKKRRKSYMENLTIFFFLIYLLKGKIKPCPIQTIVSVDHPCFQNMAV